MPETVTTPQERESKPRTDWDIGKAMNSMFSPREAPADDKQQLEAAADPDEGTPADDEAEEVEASGGEDAEPEGEQTSDEPFLVLKVEGREIKIGSKEEAIPLAQKGMHYTQEMQKLREREAQLSSEHEQASSTLRQQVDQYQGALKTLHETYSFVLGKDAPDWASAEMQKLKAEKPQEYLAVREQWDQLASIRSELSRIEQDKQKEADKQWQTWVRTEQSVLAEKRPEWTDATKRQQDWSLIRDYATSQGITEQEVSNLFDHRYWLILHDAARYRQAEATGKKKVATTGSKTVEPGTGKNVNQGERRFRQERDRLKSTGDVRAAGNILQELMTRKK